MKIGIITHYYKSRNYGGNLQAYALCKYLNSIDGVTAEQVCYSLSGLLRKRPPLNTKLACKYIKRVFTKTAESIHSVVYRKQDQRASKALEAIDAFNYSIPHSKTVYNADNISKANCEYDAFITGSDQVWSPNVYCTGYLLTFVSEDRLKISYAASISKDSLSNDEKEVFKNALTGFRGISVREDLAVTLLSELTRSPVVQVADPVFLLDRSHWQALCCNEDVPSGKYMLCYFLGNDRKHRKIASQAAEMMNLKIISIPDLLGIYRPSDRILKGELLYGVSVEKMLALINNAEFVVTDSYHISAFSYIFKKQFAVFGRIDGGNSMNSRLDTLLGMINMKDRLIDTDDRSCAKLIASLERADYFNSSEELERLKMFSMDFLNDALFQGQGK